MSVNRDAIAALLLLVLFLAYGLQARLIELFPGQETEVFSPRTLPYALAIAGVLFCFTQLLRCLRSPASGDAAWRGYDWGRAALLCLAMIVYGLIFTPLGFVVATAAFLLTCIAILGERRPLFLVSLPALFSVGFWAVMTKVLGLYLAPGFWGT